MQKRAIWALVSVFLAWTASAEQFDLVLRGGRVIDPETGLDATRDVGIRGYRIASISAVSLDGTRVIDVRGFVVAPGFIDLHQHQQDNESYRLKALDGVTTALELETGVPDLKRFLEVRRNKSLINYGATASHEAARVIAWGLPLVSANMGPAAAIADPAEGPVTNEAASPERLSRILSLLRTELSAGALGIGVGLQYTPGATYEELIDVFRLAAEFKRPVFIHIRSSGRIAPYTGFDAVGEVIGAAAITGAPLHIVHINSMCARDTLKCLDLIAGARARGLDVTTEFYPYGAFMTFVNSAAFNAGWPERDGMDYGDLELPETGERLTKERFDKLHASPEPIVVLGHLNPDSVVDTIAVQPLVMVASDGIKEHPRNAGTYTRVLSRYVRSQGSLTLLDAIRKMSLMPAQRLEGATLAARRKGRLQYGADADIVVFDLQRIEDKATFRASTTPSVGVRYVIVGGTLVVEDGRVIEGVAPGRPIVADEASW